MNPRIRIQSERQTSRTRQPGDPLEQAPIAKVRPSTFKHRIGLGGYRERYTEGETLWMIAVTIVISTVFGAAVTMAIVAAIG